jgi:hypothetical protein
LNQRMNNRSRAILAARLVGGATVAASLSLLLTGCGKDTFARVNGQTVTKEEYVKALEHQQVALPGGQPPTNAERAVLDQIITNKIIMSEAAKQNVVPSDETVASYYNLQKKLFEEQMPQGKDYETSMREQGVTPEDTRANLKIQLAETALYAKELKLTDDQVHKIYDNARGQFGLPARVLLRLILVAPNSPDMGRAKQMLDAKTDYIQVARAVNPPALRATAGLLPQFTPIDKITPKYQPAIQQGKVGDVIGPVDFQIAANQPAAKAWIRIEDKRPPFSVAFEDAAPLIRQQLVQNQIQQPQNASLRNQIINDKLQASFEPADAQYAAVWDAIKKSAKDAGIGQPVAGAAPVAAPATLGK